MTKFSDIIGYQHIVDELKRLCDLLTNKEKYTKLGVEIPQTLLLYGEPGVGKTLMAKALIDESNRKCIYCSKTTPDGQFVEQIQKSFAEAVNQAPSILFLDDMDKFAEDNLQYNCNKEEFVTIQSCLEEIRGKDVFVIATANDIDYLPESLLRTGRFGRKLKVKAPTHADAVKIISHYLSRKPIKCEVSAESLAYVLSNMSCVVLENVVNEASILAGYRNADTIQKQDIICAVKHVVHNNYQEITMSKEERCQVAIHEAGHCVMGLIKNLTVGFATLSGINGNGICQVSAQKEFSTFADFENTILVPLAGMASMELLLNQQDMGAHGDLEKASEDLLFAIERGAFFGFEHLYIVGNYVEKQFDF